MRRIDIIDILKGYSIFTITIFHYLQFLGLPSPFDKIINFGGTGVHLFALLSGLGLYYSHIHKPLNYADFIKKRFLKIYVPYIAVVLLSAFISVFIPVYKNSWYALGGHVFLYKMFDESIMGSYGYQLWFISMILQFYFAFYLIVWVKERLNEKWFIATGVMISLAWAFLVFVTGHENERVWNSFFLQYYWEFAIGMVIGERLAKNQRVIDMPIKNWLLLVIALVNCMLYALMALKGGAFGKLFNDYFALIGYSLLALWLFNLNIKFINQIFLYIGNISLSVYLLHFLVLLAIANVIDATPLVQIILSLILLIPVSVVYQKGVNAFFRIAKF